MFRSLLAVLLAASALAATAQTAPAPAKKPARPIMRRSPRPAAPKAAPAPAATTDDGFGSEAPSSSANDGGKGQGVYAAPGMPVDIKSGKQVEPYNSTNEKPGDKPAKRTTTLSPK